MAKLHLCYAVYASSLNMLKSCSAANVPCSTSGTVSIGVVWVSNTQHLPLFGDFVFMKLSISAVVNTF